MRRWLTIPEAARRVGRSQATIYAWIRAGHLRRYWFFRDGRVVAGVLDQSLVKVAGVMQERRGRPRKR